VLFRQGSTEGLGDAAAATELPVRATGGTMPSDGFIRGPLGLGGSDYLTTYRRTDIANLVVAVSLSEKDLLSQWWFEALAVLIFIVVAGVFLFRTSPDQRRRDGRRRVGARRRTARRPPIVVRGLACVDARGPGLARRRQWLVPASSKRRPMRRSTKTALTKWRCRYRRRDFTCRRFDQICLSCRLLADSVEKVGVAGGRRC
jgi:hypothetical protein